MQPWFASAIFLLAIAVVSLGAYLLWRALRSWRDPVERERKRRSILYQQGRMAQALITDFRDSVFYYSYEISGVAYAASQDVSALGARVPSEPSALIGHSALKYHPRNPANSILICEEWSGLRRPTC